MKKIIGILVVSLIFSCKKNAVNRTLETYSLQSTTLKHATGFSVVHLNTMQVLEVKNPWPKADKVFRYALIDRDKAASLTLNKDEFDGIILTPVKSIVVTSTTHIPALELLNEAQSLVGFPGRDYISSTSIRQRIDQGHIRELGKNEGINTEVLLDLNPEVVIGYGVSGINKNFETIQKSNIPVIYNGDWVETSALAKAEWIKFFGALYNKEKEADSIFNSIEKDYLRAKSLASHVTQKPRVMAGAMHKDVWYLPSGTSPEAQFLKDANIDYLWNDTTKKGSLALSVETVLEKAQDADIWLSPSYYTSLDAMEKASSLYTKFDAFKNRSVFSFSNTKGETGGVLYYELGTARPDLVLKDIIKICHPDLLPDYEPFFFKPLQ